MLTEIATTFTMNTDEAECHLCVILQVSMTETADIKVVL